MAYFLILNNGRMEDEEHKKSWCVEGFPVPNRVLTEFTMEIKPVPPQQGISKGYAAQSQEKNCCVYSGGMHGGLACSMG